MTSVKQNNFKYKWHNSFHRGTSFLPQIFYFGTTCAGFSFFTFRWYSNGFHELGKLLRVDHRLLDVFREKREKKNLIYIHISYKVKHHYHIFRQFYKVMSPRGPTKPLRLSHCTLTTPLAWTERCNTCRMKSLGLLKLSTQDNVAYLTMAHNFYIPRTQRLLLLRVTQTSCRTQRQS
jgi:hypothetical protein